MTRVSATISVLTSAHTFSAVKNLRFAIVDSSQRNVSESARYRCGRVHHNRSGFRTLADISGRIGCSHFECQLVPVLYAMMRQIHCCGSSPTHRDPIYQFLHISGNSMYARLEMIMRCSAIQTTLFEGIVVLHLTSSVVALAEARRVKVNSYSKMLSMCVGRCDENRGMRCGWF